VPPFSDALLSREAQLARLCQLTINLAEEVRFELTEPFDSTVFKTVAIDHSATLPVTGTWSRFRTADPLRVKETLYP
jgi:hypothetical protein